ncbi:LysE family translocator [Photobacterium sp. TLY01]|uniref:LysE family translocator n=1 Tax=Photobacterium sp. TLY01 TaxID=2907534 RepID=UPI001F1EC557|nr:LysE family translocator [Photobacterium sp. TLY01]UIP29604.1 LysE family translocator [Photobacterium sp. TLY01]
MLETTQILAYMSALMLAAAIPGPGMTALVAHSVRGGAVTGFTMLSGLILGDLIYLSFAVFGLAVVAHSYGGLFTAVSWCASLYLAWLSWQFWNHNPEAINIDQQTNKRELTAAWLSGLTITLGNPKTIAFYLAILPLVITLDAVSFQTWGLLLVPLTVLVLVFVGAVFIVGALKIRRFLASAQAQTWLFKGAGVIMFLAAVSMTARMV